MMVTHDLAIFALVITSVVSLIGGAFVARAYIPHVPLRGNTPTAWLARAFAIAPAAYFVRTIYRDLYHTYIGDPPDQIWFSVGLNLALVASEYFALRARLESIREEDRAGWTIFSAPWYPKGPAIRRRRD